MDEMDLDRQDAIVVVDIYKDVDYVIVDTGYTDRISSENCMNALALILESELNDMFVSSDVKFAWIGHGAEYVSLNHQQEEDCVDVVTTAIINGISQHANGYIVFELPDRDDDFPRTIHAIISSLGHLEYCVFVDMSNTRRYKRISYGGKNIIYLEVDTESG